MRRTAALLVLAAILAGCGEKATTEPKEDIKPTATNPGLTVPTEFITEGLQYMGHPFDKRVTYEVKGMTTTGETLEVEMTPKWEGIEEGGRLTFSYAGTGALPSEVYTVTSEGIFGTQLGNTPIEPRILSMPTVLKIGESWQSDSVYSQPQPVKIRTTYKIEAIEQVEVPAGTYEAVVLSETGTLQVGDGEPANVVGKSWFVKGIGAVKRTMTQTEANGRTSEVSIVATAIK